MWLVLIFICDLSQLNNAEACRSHNRIDTRTNVFMAKSLDIKRRREQGEGNEREGENEKVDLFHLFISFSRQIQNIQFV